MGKPEAQDIPPSSGTSASARAFCNRCYRACTTAPFFTRQNKIKSAAESNLKSAAQQVDRDVYTDYANTIVAQQQTDLVMKADKEAKENLAFAEGHYSAGVGNIIELTDAELLAATASAQVVTARYNYQLAFGQ